MGGEIRSNPIDLGCVAAGRRLAQWPGMLNMYQRREICTESRVESHKRCGFGLCMWNKSLWQAPYMPALRCLRKNTAPNATAERFEGSISFFPNLRCQMQPSFMITMVSSFTLSSCRHCNVTGVTLARDWEPCNGGGGGGRWQPAVIKGQFILGGAPRGHF